MLPGLRPGQKDGVPSRLSLPGAPTQALVGPGPWAGCRLCIMNVTGGS